jgi:beta-fructofuranosidase
VGSSRAATTWEISMRNTCAFLTNIVLVVGLLGASVAKAAPRAPCVPKAGSFQRFYDPSVGEGWFWYINDHSVVRGADAQWHLFGITRPEPAWPERERLFAHATSPLLTARPWQKQPHALEADLAGGETVLWAPHVFEHAGLYYMMYCAGGADHTQFQIKLATSEDLFTWTRHPTPLFTDGYEGRDPYVLRVGDQWIMYYTATSRPEGGNYVVAYRTSTDLIHWSERAIAYRDPLWGTFGGNTESPFVVAREEGYYLFMGPRFGYVSTGVFFSKDPTHFEGPPITMLNAHAPEVVRDLDGKEYITSAGWFQGGAYMAPLRWDCSAR